MLATPRCDFKPTYASLLGYLFGPGPHTPDAMPALELPAVPEDPQQ